MALPNSEYPSALDTDVNLYKVHDSLRLTLIEDYTPGDSTIFVDGNPDIMLRFPDTGIITLTEQCSAPELRALSFYYKSKTTNSFQELELLPGFTDVSKLKDITNVTLNVVAQHHNVLKDALINIQTYLGVKDSPAESNADNLTGRVKHLREKIFTPKSWFSVNKRIGLVPFTVEFSNEAFGLGDGEIDYLWDFGDSTSSESSDTKITKTYTTPGIYGVSLRITNEYGQDTCFFPSLISARTESPAEAVVEFVSHVGQDITEGVYNEGDLVSPPKIRAKTNTFIDLRIPPGVNPDTERSYAGEELDGEDSPIDPIISYTWSLGDDLKHSNMTVARASYPIGGQYDMNLRVDTAFGAYRITTYEKSIEIIENQNVWLWTIEDNVATAYEFGLMSETFRVGSSSTLTVIRDDSFLDGTNNEDQAKFEFSRNTSFAPRGTTSSGDRGSVMLFYASGGVDIANHEIKAVEYEGFSDTYISRASVENRPWNWAALSSTSKTYFFFGQNPTESSNNLSYPFRTTYNLSTFESDTVSWGESKFQNGANELLSHVTTDSDEDDIPDNGYFAVYRTAWKDQTGYILRNDGVGDFFRIKSFYKTQGSLAEPISSITKLADMSGATKYEGQLVPLSTGLFFFNNSGSISAYNDVSGVWETGMVGTGLASFRSVQDVSVTGFDSASNTLLAASDNDRAAYLSFDYSENAFVKFSGSDLTFSSIGSRPEGEQWVMGVY